MISNLTQYNVVHLLFKYFLSRALAVILAGRAESFGQFLESLRITAAEAVDILWLHRYKIFIFFLISNIFLFNKGDFAIQTFPIKNI